MISPELMRRVRELELCAHRLIKGKTVGDTRTSKRGSGFEFHELREYAVGDDVRFIDWKASARSTDLLVRSYREDHNRTIILVVDTSSSMHYGSQALLNTTVAAEVSALIALAAYHQKDAVGLMMHNNYTPARQGTGHLMLLMQKLLQPAEQSAVPFAWDMLQSVEKNSLVIIVSDFIGCDEKIIRQIAHRHETIALRVLDPLEHSFDVDALLALQDAETGEHLYCWSPGQLQAVKQTISSWRDEQDRIFKQAQIACFDILTHRNYIDQLITFFKFYRSA